MWDVYSDDHPTFFVLSSWWWLEGDNCFLRVCPVNGGGGGGGDVFTVYSYNVEYQTLKLNILHRDKKEIKRKAYEKR